MKQTIKILFCCFFPLIIYAQETKIKYEYDDADPFSKGLARVQRNGKYGFINKEGKEVIPCKFYHVDDFSNRYPLTDFKDSLGKIGFINVSGEVIVGPKYDWFFYWDDDPSYAYVLRDGRYGFINKNGIEVIPCIYQQTQGTPEHFFNGIAQMKKDYYYGIIDTNGNTLVNFQFDKFIGFEWLDGFPKDFLGAKRDSECFYISMNNYKITKVDYDDIETFNDGMAAVKKNGRYGFINTNLSLAVPCMYDSFGECHNGFAAVQDSTGKWGYVSTTGNLAIACEYDAVEIFSCGREMVYKKGKVGFIDTAGQLIIPFEFDYDHVKDYAYKKIDGFQDSLCVIRKGNNYGMIDINGNIVLDFSYKWIRYYEDYHLNTDIWFPPEQNYILAKKNNKYYSANKKGVLNKGYISTGWIFRSGDKALVCDSKNRCGFIDSAGNLFTEKCYQYTDVSIFNGGYCRVKKAHKWGIINQDGKIIVPVIYNYLYNFIEGLAIAFSDNHFSYFDKEGKIKLELARKTNLKMR